MAQKEYLILEDIYRSVADELGITIGDAQRVADSVLRTISNSLIELRPVKIRYFGNFLLRHRTERMARNPYNPTELVLVPEHTAVVFKPSQKLKYSVIRRTVV